MKKIRLQDEDERKINVCVCVRVFVCVYLAFPALWGPNKNSNTSTF